MMPSLYLIGHAPSVSGGHSVQVGLVQESADTDHTLAVRLVDLGGGVVGRGWGL